jgi:hypothetical protein
MEVILQFIKENKPFVFTIILSLIGFLILRFSVNLGINAANAYLRSTGGSMDSEQFNSIQSLYIISNITLGGIIFLVGLTSLCFSINKFLKKEN